MQSASEHVHPYRLLILKSVKLMELTAVTFSSGTSRKMRLGSWKLKPRIR